MPRLLIALSLAVLAGCGSDVGKIDGQTMSERQDAALKDPFGYNPDVPNTAKASAATSPSNKYDDSFGAEWKRFWNP